MKHIKKFEAYTSITYDPYSKNVLSFVDYVDLDYFTTNIDNDEEYNLKSTKEKQPYNKTGRNDRETKNTFKKSTYKISAESVKYIDNYDI